MQSCSDILGVRILTREFVENTVHPVEAFPFFPAFSLSLFFLCFFLSLFHSRRFFIKLFGVWSLIASEYLTSLDRFLVPIPAAPRTVLIILWPLSPERSILPKVHLRCGQGGMWHRQWRVPAPPLEKRRSQGGEDEGAPRGCRASKSKSSFHPPVLILQGVMIHSTKKGPPVLLPLTPFLNESHCCSVSKLCLIRCDPLDCSTPGFPVLLCLLEFAQTHVHWVSDTISSSVIPFSSCLQSFPAARSFPMS